jgi:hypothetical protein
MRIKTFKVEQWMNEYENDATYNLAETCVDSMTLGELLELAGRDPKEYLAGLSDLRLTYGHIYGSPSLLKGIASLYQDVGEDDIVPTHGAIGWHSPGRDPGQKGSGYRRKVLPGIRNR